MTEQGHEPLDLEDQERTSTKSDEEERLAKEREDNDLRWVMSSKQGRRFIYRQLGEGRVWQLSFDVDPAVMAFNEGNRNRGLSLLNDLLTVCPARYTEMLAEQEETKESHDNRNADRRNNSKHSRRSRRRASRPDN